MRDKLINVIEKHGLFFCLWCIFIVIGATTLKTKDSNLDNTSNNFIDCEEVLRENQIFSSMLAEIENEPGGSEILKKLWDEHNR